MKPSKLGFETEYDDGSGPRYGVWLEGNAVRIQDASEDWIDFGVEDIDFFINALVAIKESQSIQDSEE